MRREGRQHGMVRTYKVVPDQLDPIQKRCSNSKFENRMLALLPPTAGDFSKVQTRPTNHSKFTGKCSKQRCNGCHVHPSGYSRDKSKTSNKKRSRDVVSNFRLATWRVSSDGGPVPVLNHLVGFSASRILEHLTDMNHLDDAGDDDDINQGSVYERNYDYSFHIPASCYPGSGGVDIREIGCELEEDEDGVPAKYPEMNESDEDDDRMSFCDVGFLVDQIEGEDEWFLVEDLP